MADLRDLEADRLCVDALIEFIALDLPKAVVDRKQRNLLREASQVASAALDEIERLKRLLVWQGANGNWCARVGTRMADYVVCKTEADAWAAVRKAANEKGGET